MPDSNRQHDLAAQIKNYHQADEFVKALKISARAVDSNPRDLEVWEIGNTVI